MALRGIRILDLARLGPGPHATQILGDLGAEIITIEPPPRRDGALTMPRGAPIRRNTRSITLNLKTDEGRAVFDKLVQTADAILEGFRPGVVERLGIDYAAVRERKPDIVYASLSGFGQDGPYRDVVGHDINYQGIAGILHLTGDPDRPPRIPGNAVADNAGGIAAALAVVVALLAKQRTGVGQHIDVAMTDTLMTMMLLNVNQVVDSGRSPGRGETLLTGHYCFYNVYECKDGKSVSVGAIEPWFYQNLCKLLGREDLIPDQRAEGDERVRRIEIFREIFRSKTRDEWVAELMHADTCVAPVNSLDEVIDDAHLRARGTIVDAHAKTQVGALFKLSETPATLRTPAPELGADTARVLGELGYDEAAIQAMADTGAI